MRGQGGEAIAQRERVARTDVRDVRALEGTAHRDCAARSVPDT